VPTRVLLEGPAIEPLLAQVRDEYGSGVRIISADKVRSGGVGGFFAKQHYELSVEVPDPNEDRNDMAKRNLTEKGDGASIPSKSESVNTDTKSSGSESKPATSSDAAAPKPVAKPDPKPTPKPASE